MRWQGKGNASLRNTCKRGIVQQRAADDGVCVEMKEEPKKEEKKKKKRKRGSWKGELIDGGSFRKARAPFAD
jgi:hypothetical protein